MFNTSTSLLNISPRTIAAAATATVLLLVLGTMLLQTAFGDSVQVKTNIHINEHNNCHQKDIDGAAAQSCTNTVDLIPLDAG